MNKWIYELKIILIWNMRKKNGQSQLWFLCSPRALWQIVFFFSFNFRLIFFLFEVCGLSHAYYGNTLPSPNHVENIPFSRFKAKEQKLHISIWPSLRWTSELFFCLKLNSKRLSMDGSKLYTTNICRSPHREWLTCATTEMSKLNETRVMLARQGQ